MIGDNEPITRTSRFGATWTSIRAEIRIALAHFLLIERPLAVDGSQRRLAAILAADMVGFSRLIGADEEGTLARQKAIRVEIIDPTVRKHHGRIVKSTGDGFLAEFGSAVDAARCALLIQSAMHDSEIATGDPEIVYRMGINVGDIVIDGDDIFGDGVNIAARLEGEADPGGICISRGALDHVRGKVEAEFEDLGERLLKNIAEPIHLFRLLMVGRHPAPRGGSEKLPASPGYPTIVVLPIANISGSPDLDLLAVGLTEDLVAGLARVSELRVLPRNATDIFKGKAIDARQAGRRLGVANVLEGNVQGSAKRLRVTVQLIDAVTGTYLWAARYNNDGSEILALQDDIVRKVLTEVRVKLTVGDNARTDSGTQNLDAWLLCGEGFEEWYKFTREANVRAIELFQAAHRADPKWSRPFGGLAGAYRETAIRGWGASPGKELVQAEEFAQRSIDLDPSDPRGHMQLGQIWITTGRTEEGIALCEKAVDLAPNDFGCLGTLAWELPRVGQEERALALFARARKVRPSASRPNLANEGFVAHLAGQRERALDALKECATRFDLPDARVRLAGLYMDLGRLQDARAEIAQVLARESDATIPEYTGNLPFQNETKKDWYKGLLRAAGLPDN